MDLNNNIHDEPNARDDDDESNNIEPEQLLEHCWFFGNLLIDRGKSKKMLRSLSDPYTSSSKSYEETYESIQKLTRHDELSQSSNLMMKTPSAESDPRRNNSKSNRKTSRNGLLRAPSLPITLTKEVESHDDDDDEEIEFSMGTLIRQASLNSRSAPLPPRTQAAAAKGVTSMTPRHRPRRNHDLESIRLRPQQMINQLQTRKSLPDLVPEETQPIRDLRFDSYEKDYDTPNSTTGTIIPGSQEKKRVGGRGKHTWQTAHGSSAPQVPEWAGKRSSSKQDMMKEQIKYWARAVASNVRQDCSC